MSAAVREALAAAASTVDGVAAKPYYRQSVKPGDAFVRLDLTDRDASGFGRMATWQVCILLPADQAHAEKWIDDRLNDLVAALNAEGVVTTAQPIQLNLDGPTVPALIVTVIREQE